MRCLKRYVAREVCKALVTGARQAMEIAAGHAAA